MPLLLGISKIPSIQHRWCWVVGPAAHVSPLCRRETLALHVKSRRNVQQESLIRSVYASFKRHDGVHAAVNKDTRESSTVHEPLVYDGVIFDMVRNCDDLNRGGQYHGL